MSIDLKVKLPGPKVMEIVEKERKYLAKGTKSWETPGGPTRAEGPYFWDEDGNVLLDWTNPMVVILGHSHPKWVAGMREQLENLVYFNSPDFVNRLQAETAELLTKLTPGNWEKKVFFSNSGTEANEAALKVARISTGKNLVIGFIGGFHGRTMGSLALTASKAVQRKKYTQYLNNAYSIPYAYCYRCWYKMKRETCGLYCLEVLEKYFKTVLPPDDVAAIIYEPIQGEGGYVVPPKEFIQGLHEIAKKYGILTIADEVQTGFGKTGYWFATEYFGVQPDIITVAKGLANGMPAAATVFRAELDFPEEGMHSNTFGGLVLSMRSILETYKIMVEENILQNVREVGKYFKEKLLELQETYSKVIGDVRGLGLMLAIEFVKDRETREEYQELRDLVVKKAYEKGLLLLGAGWSAIRFTPRLNITKSEVDEGIKILREAIEEALREM